MITFENIMFQTKVRLGQFEDQLETTIKKTQRKVETLKAQFHEHKKKWEHVSIWLDFLPKVPVRYSYEMNILMCVTFSSWTFCS